MNTKHVILDCLGGDRPLETNVAAVAEIIKKDQGRIPLLLVGPENEIRDALAELGVKAIPDYIQFEECDEQFHMSGHAHDVLKKNNTIMRSLKLLKEGRGSAVVSAGHTGAMFVAAVMVLGRMDGVLRPALGVVYPNKKTHTLVLDVGANVDCKAEHLFQFGIMGAIYYQKAFKQTSVRVGLLNNGEEPSKGARVTRTAYDMMQKLNKIPGVRFTGMTDAAHIFGEAPEVLVTDGYIGNLMLKSVESIVERLGFEMRRVLLKSTIFVQLGFMLTKGMWRGVKRNFDFREFGGAPMLGLRGNVFVAHGRSNGGAIAQLIRRTKNIHFGHYQDELLSTLGLFSNFKTGGKEDKI